jgi:hypothetical protein
MVNWSLAGTCIFLDKIRKFKISILIFQILFINGVTIPEEIEN